MLLTINIVVDRYNTRGEPDCMKVNVNEQQSSIQVNREFNERLLENGIVKKGRFILIDRRDAEA